MCRVVAAFCGPCSFSGTGGHKVAVAARTKLRFSVSCNMKAANRTFGATMIAGRRWS